MKPARALVAGVAALLWAGLVAAPGAAAAEPTVDLGGYRLPGGSPSTDRADPVVVPAGLWSDTLGEADSATSTHYYRYRRTIADSTVHVGVAGAAEASASDGVEIAVTAEGEDCASDSGSTSYPSGGSFGASVAIGPDDVDDRDAPCLRAETLEIAVGRGSSSADADLPIALKIVEEAPATEPQDLPEPAEITATPVAAGTPEPGEGAAGFDDAPALDPAGATVSATVAEGAERLWRVPLTWGQRLAVTVRVDTQPDDVAATYRRPSVGVHFVGPDRDRFSEVADDAETTGTYDPDEAATLLDSTPQVAYRNRYDDLPATLPGDYWIAVQVAAPTSADEEPLEVPVELSIEVAGEESGAPAYPETVTGPDGTPGPDGYGPDTPFLVGDREFSAVASGSSAPAEPGDPGRSAARTWGGAGLGVLGVGLLAAGAVWLRRARRAVA